MAQEMEIDGDGEREAQELEEEEERKALQQAEERKKRREQQAAQQYPEASRPTQSDAPITTTELAETSGSAMEDVVSDVPKEDPSVTQARLEDHARAFLVQQTHAIVIPSYSAWFDMTQIHPIERKSLPEFFNGRNRSKTPAVYKDWRDFMVNCYRLKPEEYLTFTACRRNLAGDVCAILRVHGFLEQWGLINYQVSLLIPFLTQIDPETRPGAVGPPFTGHFRVIVDTPRGLQPFQPGPAHATIPASSQRAIPTTSTQTTSAINMDLRRNMYDPPGKPDTHTNGITKESKATYNCLVCGVDCSNLRFHCTKAGQNVDLCTNCYHEARFPANLHSGDFIKLDDKTGIKKEANDWTDEEILLLLEGIEIYDEDWDQIAAHIGTRSREQCVLKFLQLPIEEPYVDAATEKAIVASGVMPFSQADNPVLSVVAFLAGVVDMKVAAKAAGRGVEELKARLKAEVGKESIMESAEDDLPSTNLEKAASVAIGAAAAKSHLLAEHTSSDNIRLLNQAINMQLRKIESKLSQFDDLEAILEQERRELERVRQEVYCERLALRREVEKAREAIRAAQAVGGEKGVEVLDSLIGKTVEGDHLEVTGESDAEDEDIEDMTGGEGLTA
jgi:SWI/SNF related-matrix-associated actin-dependent regulator of chromatin subfamily C